MTAPSVLALIPARGGSKGVPGKNIKPIAGKPLIEWTIKTALSTSCIDRVIVSTDDPRIAAVAETAGAEVPFMRPAEFAGDESLDLPVYLHALDWLRENQNYEPDIIVWLRPTTPLRQPEDIEQAVSKFKSSDADWIRSVCPVEHHPYWMYRLEDDVLNPFLPDVDVSQYMRRQLLPPLFRLNGAVEVTRPHVVCQDRNLYGGKIEAYVMPSERSVDIDTPLDFALAETLLRDKL